MRSLRTPETRARYDAYKASGGLAEGCILCDRTDTLKEFTHWRILQNLFPYDLIASVHDMLVTKRHVPDTELSEEELAELREIKQSYVQDTYEFIIEPMTKIRSIPTHAHYHLLVPKQ